MRMRLVPAFSAAVLVLLVLAGCASNGLRYTDPSGKDYEGEVERLSNTMTARIGGTVYRGPFTVNDWGQAKSTLESPGRDPLYCQFYFRALKVKGTCTDLGGSEYALQSR